jgi:hypothetical protein
MAQREKSRGPCLRPAQAMVSDEACETSDGPPQKEDVISGSLLYLRPKARVVQGSITLAVRTAGQFDSSVTDRVVFWAFLTSPWPLCAVLLREAGGAEGEARPEIAMSRKTNSECYCLKPCPFSGHRKVVNLVTSWSAVGRGGAELPPTNGFVGFNVPRSATTRNSSSPPQPPKKCRFALKRAI